MEEEEEEVEVEVDAHNMLKTGLGSSSIMRTMTSMTTGTASEGVQTIIEHGNTTLESDLDTMVIINDKDEGEEEKQDDEE